MLKTSLCAVAMAAILALALGPALPAPAQGGPLISGAAHHPGLPNIRIQADTAPVPRTKPGSEDEAADTEAIAESEPSAEPDPVVEEEEEAETAESEPAAETATDRDGAEEAEPDATTAEVEAEAEAEAATAPPANNNALLPRVRPTGDALLVATAGHAPPGPPYGFRPAPQLAEAMRAVEDDRYDDAMRISRALADPVERRIVEWFVAGAPNSGQSSEFILRVLAANTGWPDPGKLRLRAEQAFLQAPHSDAEFAAFFKATGPVTLTGRIARARIAVRQGRTADAARHARRLWRAQRMPASTAKRFANEFGDHLDDEDDLVRLRMLVYDRLGKDAARQAARLGSDHVAFAKAVIGALGRKKISVQGLEAVPQALRDDPAYRLAQIRTLRRAGRPLAAAQILFRVDPAEESESDPDRWWDERRDLSRQLLDLGLSEMAYKVVATHRAAGEADRVEAEFHAGWYSLRFLGRAHPSKAHFQRVAGLATIPQTISRAHYWLARAHEATGHSQAARLSDSIAARYGSTFYGQLSASIIGVDESRYVSLPPITTRDRLAFSGNDIGQAIRRLAAADFGHRTWPFFEALAHGLQTPGEFALAAILARRIEQPRALLAIVSVAGRRGIDIGALNAPLIGIPKSVPLPNQVHRAMLYAVSRQESAFNLGAVSRVGARGLMQLMPATARATARSIGVSYSPQRLTRDPAYNAMLGAAYLGELISNLSGSYIMAFAGYNAGPGRAIRWAKTYGDPRDPANDAVDWIERIPFDETRNYVQKVMANLQVYRARLGLPITPVEDLSRGTPPG